MTEHIQSRCEKRPRVCNIFCCVVYLYLLGCFFGFFFAVSVGHECQKKKKYALHMHNRVTIKLRDVRLLHVKVRPIFNRPFTSVHLPRDFISVVDFIFTTSHGFLFNSNQTHIVRVSMVSAEAQRHNPRFATNCVKLCVGSLVHGFTFHTDDLLSSKLWRHAARFERLAVTILMAPLVMT